MTEHLTYFSRKTAEKILDGVIEGFSVNRVCHNDEALPAPKTFFAWVAGRGVSIHDQEWLRESYYAAQLARAEAHMDEIIEIADDSSEDYVEKERKNGDIVRELNPEAIQRATLRINTRQWVASRLYPEKYGTKALLQIKAPQLTPDEKEALLMNMIAQLPDKPPEAIEVTYTTVESDE